MSEIIFKDHKEYEFVWRNRGALLSDPSTRIKMTDALSTPDARVMFPQVINNMVRMAVEPATTITNLMTRIQFTYGQLITLPPMGAVGVADMIPEGGEYPEIQAHVGAGIKIANVNKYGVAFRWTEEMKRYSQWDLFSMYLRLATNDLVRLKEVNAVTMLLSQGVTAFDNSNPNAAATIIGNTTGRKADGTGNGSVTMEDIFDAYGLGLENGFKLDTIVVHPLTWIMWVKDPVLRAFALQNGGGSFFQSWNGNAAGSDVFSNGPLGNLGPSHKTPRKVTSDVQDIDPLQDSAPMLPNYLGIPFRIVVSPFMPYNPSTKLTSITMLASGQAGAYIEDEGVTMDEVPDKLKDMTKVKLRERYVFAPLNEGLGIVNLKSVKVVANELAISPLVQPTSTVTPESITRSTNVLD